VSVGLGDSGQYLNKGCNRCEVSTQQIMELLLRMGNLPNWGKQGNSGFPGGLKSPVIRVLDRKIPSRSFNSHGKSPVTTQRSELSSLPFTAPCCIHLINWAVVYLTFSLAHDALRRRHGTAGDKEGGRSRVRPPETSPRQEPTSKTGCIVGTRWDYGDLLLRPLV
jgi:hypothetical protein